MPSAPRSHFSITELLRADPFDAEALGHALQRLGLAETGDARNGGRLTTARAEKLIDGLTRSALERVALYAILDGLLADVANAAEPPRALLNFSRLVDAVGDRAAFFRHLHERPAVRLRLCRVLAFSQALADTLVREPELMDLLRLPARPLARAALRTRARAAVQTAANREGQLEALRRLRRRETLRIGLIDMESQTWRDAAAFETVVRQISDLAQVCVEAALAVIAAGEPPTGFSVLAMGKLGARELNYSSDIDLVFLHDGDAAAMTQLGQQLLKALTDSGIEGTLYRVDMRLRPEGKSGPLVTPLGYALNYYESFAAAWEWQALIKSRVIAGDAALGRRFRRFTRAITWARRPDDSHLRAMLEMKRRSESTPEGSDAGNVKQGPGGIRDAEWIVQQLQMMVGPQHPRVRVPDMLRALEALRGFDAVTHEEVRWLRSGYLFLRVLEHRLQLMEERAVRTIPADEAGRAALARRMGFTRRPAVAARWLMEEHERHRGEIRALCERLFWGWRDAGPALSAEDNAAADEAFGLPPDLLTADSRQRLARLHEGTSTHPLPAPLSRQIRVTLPDALRHLEHAADPERAVANLERLGDASGNRLSLLRSLADAPHLARAVFAILGGSQFLSDTLIRFPELLDLAAQRPLLAHPKSWPDARADCRSYCLTFRDRQAALRRWKRREMLRIGLRDLAMDAPPEEIIAEIAELARACLMLACDEVGAALRPASERMAFSIHGMGKLGGNEMHYRSDADVIFSYDVPAPFEGAGATATRWAEELIRYLGEATEDGTCFEVDARLRPNGRSGALAPPVDAFVEYFERDVNGIAIWERQALTRARFVAGDPQTAARLQQAIRAAAYPAAWHPGWGDELRHIKSRVENERAARGSAKGVVYDVKLGRGALSDIEFCAQWLALRHGAVHPALQTSSTLEQIDAAAGERLLSADEAEALRAAYRFLRRAELRLQITQEHTVAAVRSGTPALVHWARAVFPDEADGVAVERFEAQWQSCTTAARTVMERVRDSL